MSNDCPCNECMITRDRDRLRAEVERLRKALIEIADWCLANEWAHGLSLARAALALPAPKTHDGPPIELRSHPETIGVDIREWFAAAPPEPLSEPVLEPGRVRFVDGFDCDAVGPLARGHAPGKPCSYCRPSSPPERPIPAADAPRVPTGGDSLTNPTAPPSDPSAKEGE